MRFALGTLRAPKIDGIRQWVALCPYLPGDHEFQWYDVPSGISAMPISIEEVLLGAKNRAQAIVANGVEADFYVWIEGGTTRVGEKSYLFGSVYVQDAEWNGHYGLSPMIEVSSKIDALLYVEKQELGKIMGDLSGNVDIRSQNGSMGAWSDDMFTRSDEFSAAFRAAIAPFFNPYYRLK